MRGWKIERKKKREDGIFICFNVILEVALIPPQRLRGPALWKPLDSNSKVVRGYRELIFQLAKKSKSKPSPYTFYTVYCTGELYDAKLSREILQQNTVPFIKLSLKILWPFPVRAMHPVGHFHHLSRKSISTCCLVLQKMHLTYYKSSNLSAGPPFPVLFPFPAAVCTVQ